PVIGGAAQAPVAVAAVPPAGDASPGVTPAAVEPAQASNTAQSAPAAEPASAAAATAAPSTPTPGANAASGSEAATDRFSVQLAATRPCWVSAVVDGRKQIDRLMQTGERATIEVHRELVLTAGDAEALKLTFN